MWFQWVYGPNLTRIIVLGLVLKPDTSLEKCLEYLNFCCVSYEKYVGILGTEIIYGVFSIYNSLIFELILSSFHMPRNLGHKLLLCYYYFSINYQDL